MGFISKKLAIRFIPFSNPDVLILVKKASDAIFRKSMHGVTIYTYIFTASVVGEKRCMNCKVMFNITVSNCK